MTQTFAIKSKATGEFFGGFDRDGASIWTADSAKAWLRDNLTATAQAALLIAMGIPAQRKTVSL